MHTLEGRVAVITGGGRGIGREHALFFASEGAKVIVNDLGVALDGDGNSNGPAEEVAAEIRSRGGQAISNTADVATWSGAESLLHSALEEFGDVHVLVNNAGIVRDRMLVNMSEDEWDMVIRVNLKGHFCPTRQIAGYWRAQSHNGDRIPRSIINTSSGSGLFGNVGQANYGAAKMGVAGFTLIAAQELARYGVRVNAIAPAALTRLTDGISSVRQQGADGGPLDPSHISPFVAYLATEDCQISGRVFFVVGGQVHLFKPWSVVDSIEVEDRWTVEALQESAQRFASVEFDLRNPMRSALASIHLQSFP